MASPAATPDTLRYMKTPSLKAQGALERVIELRRAAELRALDAQQRCGEANTNSRLAMVQSLLSSAQRRGDVDVRRPAARALMRDVAECPARRSGDGPADSTSDSSMSSEEELSEEWSVPTSEDDAEGDFIHHPHPWDPPLLTLDDQQEISDIVAWVGHQRKVSKSSPSHRATLAHMTPPLTFTKAGFGIRSSSKRKSQKSAKKACGREGGCGQKKAVRRCGGVGDCGFRLPPSTAHYTENNQNEEEDRLAAIRRAGRRVAQDSSPRLQAASPSKKESTFRERADPLQLLSDARRRDALRHEVHTATQVDEYSSARLSSVRRAAAASQHVLPKLWTTSS